MGLSVKDRHFGAYCLCGILVFISLRQGQTLTEEIEATPTNTYAMQLGELSMPQYIFLLLMYLEVALMYAMGILPIEIDLGGVLGTSRTTEAPESDSARSITNYYQMYDSHRHKSFEVGPLLWECSLQFVCDVDFWAHRDHNTFVEDTLATWYRNLGNFTFFRNKSRTFSGLPDTCSDMYPCPFNMQDAVGIHIPGSSPNSIAESEHTEDRYRLMPDTLRAFMTPLLVDALMRWWSST